MTENSGLATIAARGAGVTITGQLIRLLVQVAAFVLLARLLTPDDYGLVAMVIVVFGVGEVVRDAGLSSAAIQVHSLNTNQRDNLFWTNAGVGLALAGTAVLIAGPLANLYGDARVATVAHVLAATFALNGLSTQHRASLNRDMRFRALAIVDTVPYIAATVIAVVLAIYGLEYWALVYQQIAAASISFILVIAVARWVPGPPRRGANTGSLFRFGGDVLGVQSLVYISRNLDQMIIGSMLGATALGIYNRAMQMLVLPLSQVNAPATRVALPVLSRLASDSKRYDLYILRGQTVLLNITLPMLSVAAALADLIVPTVLGDQWERAVPIFQILTLGGLGQLAAYATYWGFLSRGLTRSNLWFTVMTRPILIGPIVLGAVWGVYGVAVGYAVGSLLAWPLGLLWIARVDAQYPARAVLRNGFRALSAYGGSGLVALGVVSSAADLHVVLALLLGVGSYLGSLGTVMALFPSLRRDAHTVWRTVRGMSRSGQSAADQA